MKINKFIIFTVISGMLAMVGCKDSFLDQEPPLSMGEQDIYSSPKRIEATLRGLYAAIKNTGSKSLFGGKTYLVFDNRGDDIANISNNLVTLFDTYNMKVGDTYAENEDTWTYAYLAINKVNVFLEGIEDAKDIIPESYEQYKAEAKFVRALTYYYLNNLYSQPYVLDPNAKSVPLRLTAEKSAANNNMPRSTVKEVYEQILKDLEDISALPTQNQSTETVTRATQSAANMLKMRVYMAMGDWQNAINAGNAVKGYELTKDAKAPFSAPYTTIENIFSLPMDATNIPNTQQALGEYYHNGEIMILDATHGITSKANYSLANDKRIEAFKGEENKYLKFIDAKDKLDWVPIFRYAETLLNLAECHFNLNNMTEAKTYLKQVRARSVEATTDPLNIDGLSDNDLKEAIYNEKRLETLGEGIRGIDILRRGEVYSKAGTITVSPNDPGYIWPIPQSEKLINGDVNK